jgi:hypothetical protein
MKCKSALTLDTAIIPHKSKTLLCLSDYIDMRIKHCKKCEEEWTTNMVEREGCIYHQECFDEIPQSNPMVDAWIEDLVYGTQESKKVLKQTTEQSLKTDQDSFTQKLAYENGVQITTVQQSNPTALHSKIYSSNYLQQYYKVQDQPRSYYNPQHPPPSYLAQMLALPCNQGVNQVNISQQQYQPTQYMVKAEIVLPKASKRKQNLENFSPELKQKRARVSITDAQRQILEAMYAEKQFPSSAERCMLGKQTGLNPRQVQIWFQNVRSKDKKLKKIPKIEATDVIEVDASVEEALNYFEQL